MRHNHGLSNVTAVIAATEIGENDASGVGKRRYLPIMMAPFGPPSRIGAVSTAVGKTVEPRLPTARAVKMVSVMSLNERSQDAGQSRCCEGTGSSAALSSEPKALFSHLKEITRKRGRTRQPTLVFSVFNKSQQPVHQFTLIQSKLSLKTTRRRDFHTSASSLRFEASVWMFFFIERR